MLKLVICGACGRMGKRIIACAAGGEGLAISGAVEHELHPCLGLDAGDLAGAGTIGVPVSADLAASVAACDVIVDFSTHEASAKNAGIAAARGRPIVIGTTGMSVEELEAVRNAARAVACLVSPNMSVGVNLLFRMAGELAGALGDEYDVEIVEAHHRLKKDAPSGTARRLAAIIAAARGIDLARHAVYGRSGEPGERPRGQIGIHAIRQGDIVGEHMVSFAATGERIELVHRASSRDAFARGALRAAAWIAGKAPGLYDMGDVLGLNPGKAAPRG